MKKLPKRAGHQNSCTKAEAIDSVSDDCEDPSDDEVEVDDAVPDDEVSLGFEIGFEILEPPAVAVAGVPVVESVSEEAPPTALPPAPSLDSLEAEVAVELAKSGRAVAGATTDEEVVEGRTVVKLDVVSIFTQSRS